MHHNYLIFTGPLKLVFN